jgi:hypothetical protein
MKTLNVKNILKGKLYHLNEFKKMQNISLKYVFTSQRSETVCLHTFGELFSIFVDLLNYVDNIYFTIKCVQLFYPIFIFPKFPSLKLYLRKTFSGPPYPHT